MSDFRDYLLTITAAEPARGYLFAGDMSEEEVARLRRVFESKISVSWPSVLFVGPEEARKTGLQAIMRKMRETVEATAERLLKDAIVIGTPFPAITPESMYPGPDPIMRSEAERREEIASLRLLRVLSLPPSEDRDDGRAIDSQVDVIARLVLTIPSADNPIPPYVMAHANYALAWLYDETAPPPSLVWRVITMYTGPEKGVDR